MLYASGSIYFLIGGGIMTDLQNAKNVLSDSDFTCVVCCGDIIHTATDRGVAPLLNWMDSGLNLKGFSAADRVVGRATAFLYVLLGVQSVYARVMSRPAAEVLQGHGIECQWGTLTNGIINRKGDGPCPFEAAVMDIRDADLALEAIRRKRKQMQEAMG